MSDYPETRIRFSLNGHIILRWHPPAPFALAHAVTEDDVYEGMFIPAGSTVVANV